MNLETEVPEEFVFQLAKVFYCVAASDKIIREEEKQALRKIVEIEWKQLDIKVSKSNVGFETLLNDFFNTLLEEKPEVTNLITEFSKYYSTNQNLFEESIKRLTLKTAFKIAGSFSANNKSELVILSTIYLLFYPLEK